MINGSDFEKPILELESKIAELKALASDGSIDLSGEIKNLEVTIIKPASGWNLSKLEI